MTITYQYHWYWHLMTNINSFEFYFDYYKLLFKIVLEEIKHVTLQGTALQPPSYTLIKNRYTTLKILCKFFFIPAALYAGHMVQLKKIHFFFYFLQMFVRFEFLIWIRGSWNGACFQQSGLWISKPRSLPFTSMLSAVLRSVYILLFQVSDKLSTVIVSNLTDIT